MSTRHSIDGEGDLALRSGEVLAGQYSIVVTRFPARSAWHAEGRFELKAESPYDAAIEMAFAPSYQGGRPRPERISTKRSTILSGSTAGGGSD